MSGLKIGAKFTFTPAAFAMEKQDECGVRRIRRSVTGRVCGINWAHRFFQAAYSINGYTLIECFKF